MSKISFLPSEVVKKENLSFQEQLRNLNKWLMFLHQCNLLVCRPSYIHTLYCCTVPQAAAPLSVQPYRKNTEKATIEERKYIHKHILAFR